MEEQSIEPCLRSIVHQEYDHGEYEVIVSDAMSTDRTLEIARRYTHNIVTSARRGIAFGRNVGALSAQGEIFLFVDADATLAPDFLSQCDSVFDHQSVVAVSGIAYPADGKFFPRAVYHGTYLLVRFFSLLGIYLFPGICVAYRRSAFEAVQGFREDFGIVEDLDLSRRVSKIGKCRVVPAAHAYVSTRRLEKHGLSTVLFHIYSDILYLLTGTAARYYPKKEEVHSWRDLWIQLRHKAKK
jgi:cellulose synthase/poly-beta-1,6-N-acetylglucosamine synthase-like glycosyltransferase